MQISERTQNILILIGVPIFVIVCMAVATGSETILFVVMPIFFNLASVYMAWLLVRAHRTGMIYAGGGIPTERSKNPRLFAYHFGLFAFALALILCFTLIIDLMVLIWLFGAFAGAVSQ
ncbi:hypothetical protein [Stakelama tenebrarum]|uniref:Uncharacterized protein n=1 Tax=Stakelama tenebrarum TaxID=2711215 RepID=A0A6G6Y748_9SPHN|nr:hypothetical protein [Sphingosinithalassobacter tenebrarum]QIG80740.1 hypothetical protein G5C33_13730 [Sphingosinithalassobacter tenebrarum]